MKNLILALFLCLLLPLTSLSSEFSPLSDIEEKILAGDLKGARAIFNSGQFAVKTSPGYWYQIQGEVSSVIRYFEELARFRDYAGTPGKEQQIVLLSKNLIWARDQIPTQLHFSKTLVERVETTNKENAVIYSAATQIIKEQEAAIQKERQDKIEKEEAEAQAEQAEYDAAAAAQEKVCGDDLGEIRVGMKLSRVEQCFGKFFLVGQFKANKDIYFKYRRGDTYLHVRDGRVIAWNSY